MNDFRQPAGQKLNEMLTTWDSGGAVLLVSRALLSLMSAAVVWFVKSFYFLLFFLRQKYQVL